MQRPKKNSHNEFDNEKISGDQLLTHSANHFTGPIQA